MKTLATTLALGLFALAGTTAVQAESIWPGDPTIRMSNNSGATNGPATRGLFGMNVLNGFTDTSDATLDERRAQHDARAARGEFAPR